MRTRVVALAAALLAMAVVALLLSQRKPAPPAPAPAAQTELKPSGSYADDWQADCAPLTGPAQAACTARLDAAYGKSDAAPVPVPGR